jgi:hypothetical protein
MILYNNIGEGGAKYDIFLGMGWGGGMPKYDSWLQIP